MLIINKTNIYIKIILNIHSSIYPKTPLSASVIPLSILLVSLIFINILFAYFKISIVSLFIAIILSYLSSQEHMVATLSIIVIYKYFPILSFTERPLKRPIFKASRIKMCNFLLPFCTFSIFVLYIPVNLTLKFSIQI